MSPYRAYVSGLVKPFLLVALFFCLSVGRAQNISLVGSFKPSQSGFGDVWGNGDIACMGVWLSAGYANGWGVGLIDISDPSTPSLLSTYNYGSTTQNRFEQGVIRSNVLYVGCWASGTSWSGSGLHILSITNPSSPTLISRITRRTSGTVTNGFDDVHTLFLERDFLYEAAHNTNTLNVKVFNVSNPAAPVYVRDIVTTNTTKVHQMTIGMKGTNTILYTSGWGGANNGNLNSYGQTDIWDVSNIGTQPAKWLGRLYSGYNSHSSWPTPDGNTLVVNRETPGGDVSFYDISTPSNPTPSASPNPAPFLVITPASMGIEGDIPHNPVIISNLLFLSWYQNGLQIFDITDRTKPVRVGSYDTYLIPGVTNDYAGNWGVYPNLGLNKILLSDINNGFFILDASAVLTATNNYPPLLVKSPTNQTVFQGSTAMLRTTVTGSSLNYRWFFNGSPIATGTASSLVISNIANGDSGNYFVIASNTLQTVTRAVTSAVATLSVVVPTNMVPTITSQPQDVSIYAGQSASFSVAVVGSAPFSFQWRFKDVDILNETNNSLTLQNVQGDAVGNYSVLITNSYGATLSSNALLTIIDSPYISAVQSAPGAHAALISWRTSVPTDSQVQFDPDGASGQAQMAAASSSAGFSQASYTDTALTTNHSILLSGLNPMTTYNYQVVSNDETNSYVSGVYSFTTAGAEIVIDNPKATYTGSWNTNGTSSVDKYLTNYAFATSVGGAANATATFTPNFAVPGKYDVYVWFPQGTNRCTNTPYFISYKGGSLTSRVNQQTNGGSWKLIASSIPFAAGTSGFVRISNDAAPVGKVTMADGVRFVYVDSQDLPTDGSIPAWWSTFYFGNSAVDPNVDSDGDGYSNAQEYILGTSPIDAEKKLGVKVFRSGGIANVVFSPYLGDRAYTLLHSSDLSPSWSPASAGAITPDSYGEGVFSLSITNSANDFYRLAVQLNSGGAFRGGTPAYSGSVTLSADLALSPYASDPVCGPNRAYVRPRGRSRR